MAGTEEPSLMSCLHVLTGDFYRVFTREKQGCGLRVARGKMSLRVYLFTNESAGQEGVQLDGGHSDSPGMTYLRRDYWRNVSLV